MTDITMKVAQSWRSLTVHRVSWFLNLFLRPLGWYTYGSEDTHRRWFHRSEEGSKFDDPPKPRRRGTLRCIAFENVWFDWKRGIALRFRLRHDGEGTFQLYYSIPLIIAQWITLDVDYLEWIKKIAGEYSSATYGFSIDSWGIKFKWKQSEDGWRVQQKGVIDFYWDWIDFKGKVTHTRVALDTHTVTFTQPAYRQRPASSHVMTLTREERTWRYSNPFARTIQRVDWDIKLEDPPKFSGKGENSWDCGDNGIYGTSCDGNLTISQAVDYYIQRVEESRKRYG